MIFHELTRWESIDGRSNQIQQYYQTLLRVFVRKKLHLNSVRNWVLFIQCTISDSVSIWQLFRFWGVIIYQLSQPILVNVQTYHECFSNKYSIEPSADESSISQWIFLLFLMFCADADSNNYRSIWVKFFRAHFLSTNQSTQSLLNTVGPKTRKKMFHWRFATSFQKNLTLSFIS